MLTAHHLTRAHGANVVLRDLDLRVVAGTRLGVVGPNGSGKTTLLTLLAGDDQPDGGTVTRVTGTTVGYARQDVTGLRHDRVLDAVVAGAAEVVDIEARLRALEQQIADTPPGPGQDVLLARYGTLQDRFANASGYSLEAQARKVLAGLGFTTAQMDAGIATLSGGWMMRVALARLLLTRPDVLLLDEPTNHLDFDSAEWLADHLAAQDSALVAVSHDRWFLDRVATDVLELDGHAGHALYHGNYSAYVEQRDAARARLEAAAQTQARQVADTEAFIERFRAKATKARQVQSRIKALDKVERITVPEQRRPRLRLSLPTPPRSGRDVALLDGVTKRYGATTVFDGLDLVIERGWTVAVIGPNGAGKSTLLRLLSGLEAPDAGECVLGHGVAPAYFAQHHVDALDLDRTVLAAMEQVLGDRATNPRALLGAFGFPGDTVEKRVGVCSGGERARLALARMVVGPANLLCLDEPTNHLDLHSRELLTAALAEYAGTVVLVTHDRELIRATADRICVVGEGTATVHDGDLDSYLAARAAAGAAPAGDDGDAGPQRPDRRQQRRVEAEARRRTQGLRDALSAAEAELEAAEQQVADVERALADPDVYEDPERVRELSLTHKVALDRAAAAEARWEQLVSDLDDAMAQAEAGAARAVR